MVVCFFLIARRSVDSVRPKHVADKYCASYFLVWSRRRMPFETGLDVLGVGTFPGICSGIFDNGISHKPFSLRFPVMTTLLFFSTFKEYLDNNTKQLSSDN